MTWRDKLQPATFRGVPFFVDGHEAQFGRRVALHEFAQRDVPFAEDMGRAVRRFNVKAYVLGADYMTVRDQLIAATERKGPGQLEHPYLGEMQVSCMGCKLAETTSEGGLARLDLEFVETGDARFPTASASSAATVVASSDAASQAVQAAFARRHTVAGRPAFVAAASMSIADQALTSINAAAASVRGVGSFVAALQRQVDSARSGLLALVFVPAQLGGGLVGAVQLLARSVASTPRDALSLARTLYGFGAGLPSVAPSTASRRVQADNQAALLSVVRVAAAAEGARAAAGIDWASYDEAVAARDALLGVLDGAMLEPGVDDDVFDALRSLRSAVVRDIAERGADLARVVTYTPRTTLPVLAIAQALYADANRAVELAGRNALRHPLFVPGAQALEVLDYGR